MFRLTRDGEYGVRAVLHLSANPLAFCGMREIARAQGIPENYLAKIMQQLARRELVRSRRGASGGYALARSPRHMTLRQVIEAIEGPIFLNVCLIKKGECPRDDICPVHDVWRTAQKKLLQALDSRTMEDLVRDGLKKARRAGKKLNGADTRQPREAG